MTAPRIWFYPPSRHIGRFIEHGSDEWNRCTVAIGFGFTGRLIIARRGTCLRVDRKLAMAYVTVPIQTPECSIRTIAPHPQVSIDVTAKGEVCGVEIHLPTRHHPEESL